MEKNKIYLGDAYKLIKELPDNSVDCIYTDVPYLFDSHGKGSSELAERMDKKNKDLIRLQDGFDYKILDDFIRVMKKINIIIWISSLQIRDILNYFMDNGATTFRILTWHKTNPSPTTNNNWLPDTEFAIHFREKGVSVNDGYDLKFTYYISSLNKEDKELYDHPTIKPLEFVKKHLEHITQNNDIILDPFLGSGTTAIACKELGRNYIGFEDYEPYYKIAVDRLNNITQVERRARDNGILDIFDFGVEE
jgi:DNA modification methylase